MPRIQVGLPIDSEEVSCTLETFPSAGFKVTGHMYRPNRCGFKVDELFGGFWFDSISSNYAI